MAFKETKDLITIRVPTKEPGYELNGRIWTKSSEPGIWADGVLYCGIRGARMLTLDGAVEFRHDTDGADNSANSQHTGTLLALVRDGEALRAHVYEPGQDELGQLARREGINTGSASYIDVGTSSDLGKQIIKFTSNTGRTFIVPQKDLGLSVKPKGGVTEYGTNEAVLKLMPQCAEKNAAYIAGRNSDKGFVWFDRPVLQSEQMRIRPVVLGGVGCIDDGVCADYDFGYSRRARGEVHVGQKNSTQK